MRLILTVLVLLPSLLRAQAADTSAPDTVFLRAQRMVADGKADAGRALVHAQMLNAPTGSPRYVEALFWRGALAATAADAERDFRLIIIDYPLSRWSEEALLRLAQLELTRGDRRQALAHLERLALERPSSASRPRASYWMARVLFDEGNVALACVRLAEARAMAAPGDAELRNQLDYYNQRCTGVDTSVVALGPTPLERRDSLLPTARDTITRAVPKVEVKPSTPSATTPARPKAPDPAPARASRQEYTIQVAAYNTSRAAESLRSSLSKRGYRAHVAKAGNVYRVQIGRYDTHAAAVKALGQLRSKSISGFITTRD
ncbi:MAG: SPOR domain-containing protein [Gemmatimonadaceae bacterium]